MYITDFEYDGEMLSDHGVILGNINNSNDDNTPLGMILTPNTIKNLDVNYITSTQYDEVLTRSFEIIKNPCGNLLQDGLYFTEEEILTLTSWLERKEYKRFKPLYDDGSFSDIVFYGIFSIEAVKLNGNVIGMNLTLTTNAPYAFGDDVRIIATLSSDNNLFRIYNSSQEYGYLYPEKMTVTCNESGTLSLYNQTDNQPHVTKVENCVSGEVITFYCKQKIIESSVAHENLYNDFNYNFPRLVTEYNHPENMMGIYDANSSIKNISVELIFRPIKKVGVI